MNVLLSVKPKYAEKIVKGTKKYEFRKSVFKNNDIDKVYIYSSSPVSKIIGSFEIEKILKDPPEMIWKLCQKYSGISKKDFFSYFTNSNMAYAIEIGDIDRFKEPIDPYHIFEHFKPPQSFYYVPTNYLQSLWDAQDKELVKSAISTGSMREISFIKPL